MTIAVVQGVNMRKKHQRQQQTKAVATFPPDHRIRRPIDISNVMLVCPKCDEPTCRDPTQENKVTVFARTARR
jgi:ribosomal protein L24